MNKLAGLLIILAFSKAAFAESPIIQVVNENNRLEAAMELDVLLPLIMVQEIGQATKSACINLYPEYREEINFTYGKWPPSQSRVEVYLDGRRVDPYRKLRVFAEEKMKIKALVSSRNSGSERLCRQIDLVMMKLSAELMPANYFELLKVELK